jgi:hypothetical protein
MGIELSLASSAGPPEATPPPQVQPTSELLVSEWTSILSFLFQIEQPEETAPEPSVNSDSPVVSGAPVSLDRMFFWAGLQTYVPPVLIEEPIAPNKLNGIEPGVPLGEAEDEEVSGQLAGDGDGFELTACEWTIVPTSVQPTPQPAVLPITISEGDLSDHPVSADPVPTLRDAASAPPPRDPTLRGPVAVEAVFQVQPATSETPPRYTSNLSRRDDTLPTAAPRLWNGETLKLEGEQAEEFVVPQHGLGHSSAKEPSDENQRGSQDETGGESPPENRDSAEPRATMPGSDHGLLAIPVPAHTRAARAEDNTEVIPQEQFRQSIEDSLNISSPERRAAPLQFQLRISPDDFGAPNRENAGEVRLNLFQRGDEILMKIQGGGEPLAMRAQSEWEGLVERLKPHGVEATSSAFSSEQARREGEPVRTSMPEEAVPDAAANQGEEQRRFGQDQQQQHHQRQQRQRQLTQVGANALTFSLDGGPPSPQGT